MNYEEVKRWCLSQIGPDECLSLEQRQRAKAILVAIEAASAPPWLSDAAEAHSLAHKLRDPKFYTARTKRAVNSGGVL